MTQSADCIRCGKPTYYDPELALGEGVVCETCSTRDHLESQARINDAVCRARWDFLCPPQFMDTVISRLPCPTISNAALNWDFKEGTGLNLWGYPDTGKTRTLFLILKSRMMRGSRAIALGPGEFVVELGKRLYSAKAEWIHKLCKVDFLAFDDMDKMSLTRDQESALFGILDKRMTYRLPCLFTHNSTASQLEYKFRNGAAMVRRIRHFTRSIHFPGKQKQLI